MRGGPAAGRGVSSSSPASSSSRDVPMRQRRCAKCARPRPAVRASGVSSSSAAFTSRCRQAEESRSRPSGSGADSGTRQAGHTAGASWSGTGASCVSGASASTRCALVPVKPKPETPATLGPPSAGHGVAVSTTRTFMSAQATCGLGAAKWRLAGMTPWRIASTVLKIPAMPAADSQCPMLLFNAPMCKG
jgi:hypothetical protein